MVVHIRQFEDSNMDNCKISFTVAEAEAATGIHHRKILKAIRAKELRARELGREKIILRQDLETFLAQLPPCGSKEA